MNRSIGVFDSGMGGLSTLIELKKVLPNENFIYYGDSENAPYGTRSSEEILELTINVAEKLIARNIKALVIACNTATSVAVAELRRRYKDLIIIGVEPALKVGVDTGSKDIMVMATNATLYEKKFKNLSEKYAKSCNIIKVPCPELVQIAENGLLEDEELCKKQLSIYFDEHKDKPIDTIVLGCTHFIFYKDYIRELVGENCAIVDGNLGTAKHLKNRLSEHGILDLSKKIGDIEFINSQIKRPGQIDKLELSKKIYNMYCTK